MGNMAERELLLLEALLYLEQRGKLTKSDVIMQRVATFLLRSKDASTQRMMLIRG